NHSLHLCALPSFPTRRSSDLLGTIGKTPVIRIQRLAPKHVTMYVKCEFFNPLGSVKDRLAIAIIEDAEKKGTLKPGQTVVEATSDRKSTRLNSSHQIISYAVF